MRSLHGLAVFALAGLAWAVDWAKDVTSHFVEPHSREHVQAVSKERGKPAMVIVMTSWCAACSALRGSVNSGAKVKPLLDKFAVAYAPEEGAANVWTESGENYVPQVYFYSSTGRQLRVFAGDKFKYFFQDEANLEEAMKHALTLEAEGGKGDAADTTTVAAHAAAGGASAGGVHTVSASPEPEHKEVIFDPAHAFDKSIAGHFLDNLKPEDLQKKALEANRPFMVVLTQDWCQACQDLIHDVNSGKKTKDLLSAFVITNAYGPDGLRNWQPAGENYVPQALFFDSDGTLLDVKSKHDQYKHFFSTDEELSSGMAMALDASKTVGEL